MAEAAGLALGVVSISALFSTCVELADYIKLASNLGSDYEATYTKFLLLKSRLVGSGSKIVLMLEDRNDRDNGECWKQYEILTARALVAIKDLLENANKLEQKYGLRQEGEGDTLLLKMKSCESSTLREVDHVLQVTSRQRQRKIHLGRKIVWAIRDKKAFDCLISDLAFHVNELENIVIRAGEKLQSTLPNLPWRMSPAAIQLLEAAASDSDLPDSMSVMVDPRSSQTSSDGHLYLRNQIKERARVIQGDIGETGPHSRQHVYKENYISGDAKVLQGNLSSDFMEDFWND